MPLQFSALAESSLIEILDYYAEVVSEAFSQSIEERIMSQILAIEGFEMSIPHSEVFPTTRKLVISKLPYVAFIRQLDENTREVVDIVRTSRKLPKSSS